MSKPLSILFPFYNDEHHKFLFSKWWFRLLLIVYVFAVIASPVVISLWIVSGATDWCWNLVQYLTETGAEHTSWQEQKAECLAEHAKIAPFAYASMLIGPIVFHCLTLFVFFKVVVDFIALGRIPKRR